MAGAVLTVRFNLEEAHKHLAASVISVESGNPEEAYRCALRARNGLFHARRAWSDLVGKAAPSMPVTGVAGGRAGHHGGAAAALSSAIASTEGDQASAPVRVEPFLNAAEVAFQQYLGYLRDEVGRRLSNASRG